jgi:hypothetical protein
MLQDPTACTSNSVHLTFVDVTSAAGLISRYAQSLFGPASVPRHNFTPRSPWINGFSTIDYGSCSFHPKQAGHDGMGGLAAK